MTAPGTNVIAPIVPFSTADEYPSHEAAYGRGGYRYDEQADVFVPPDEPTGT